MRVFALAVLLSTPATAQIPPSDPVDLWVSTAVGSLQDEADSPEEFLGAFALQAARGPWTVRAAYLESSRLRLNGTFNWKSDSPKQAGDRRPDVYHTLMVTAGPGTRIDRLAASATAGLGMTSGRFVDPADGSFQAFGLAVGGQGYARIVGPIWLGVEASGMVAPGLTHGGVAAGLRVDLARAH